MRQIFDNELNQSDSVTSIREGIAPSPSNRLRDTSLHFATSKVILSGPAWSTALSSGAGRVLESGYAGADDESTMAPSNFLRQTTG